MLTLVFYPYVYLLGRAAFLEQSVCVLEVGRTLGHSPSGCFFRIALPLARPAIAAGLALALMETLNDFGTVQYFAVDTFTTGIYRTWLGLGEPAAAAQLAAVLMLFVLALIMLERSTRGGGSYRHTSTRFRALPRHPLQGWRAALVLAACLLPILLGFGLPCLLLVLWSVRMAPEMVDARFLGHVANSFMMASLAALLAVALALLMAYALRLRPTRIGRIATRFAAMGYAVPGMVIAVGVMLPLAWVDSAVDGWARASLGLSTGLLLSGTIAAGRPGHRTAT